MLLKKYFTAENILTLLIFFTAIPYSFLYARSLNYIYSLPLVVLCVFYLLIYRNHERRVSVFRIIMTIFLFLTLITSVNYYNYNIQYTTYILYLTNSICPYLVFFVFYNYSSRNKDHKVIWICTLIYFLVAIYYIAYQQANRVSNYAQLNNFYFIITPLPLLFLNRRLSLQVVFLSISVFCTFISLKRSGFLIILLLGLYMLFEYVFAKAALKKKLIFLLLVVLAIYLLNSFLGLMSFSYTSRMMERIGSMGDDGGSGRVELAEGSLIKFSEMNMLELIIGKGYSAIDSERGQTNGYHTFHNDYSEVMYSFGLIGLFTLLLFIWRMLLCCLRRKQLDNDLKIPLVSSFIILIVFSLTSSVFHYFFFMLPLFIFWGYISPKLNTITPYNRHFKAN